jgi:hypothetical protein
MVLNISNQGPSETPPPPKPSPTPTNGPANSDAMSLSDFMTWYATQNKGNASGTTRSTTNERSSATSSDVNIYSLNQVRNVATNAFESALGRTPSEQELNTFLTSLNAYSKANPTKTTKSGFGTTTGLSTSKSNKAGTSTTTTGSPVSTSTSSSVSSGGVDVAGFATEQLANTTEAKAVKMDDIFRGALGALANKLGG